MLPEAKYQRCVARIYRNVFSVVPCGKMKPAAAMHKALHSQEDKAVCKKTAVVTAKLRMMKLLCFIRRTYGRCSHTPVLMYVCVAADKKTPSWFKSSVNIRYLYCHGSNILVHGKEQIFRQVRNVLRGRSFLFSGRLSLCESDSWECLTVPQVVHAEGKISPLSQKASPKREADVPKIWCCSCRWRCPV